MADCITTNPFTLPSGTATTATPDTAGISYYVKVDSATPEITITFTGCLTATVDPATDQAQPSATEVKFTTADADKEFEVKFTYRPADESPPGGPIETPTSHPKFKPQGSCPP